MKKAETGEFLYRFYRKRTSSFLANIYKASITTDSNDIHQARLDVKKIFALYDLFELVDPHAFKRFPRYKLFRPLFRQAGRIREIQVNQLLLSGDEFEKYRCDPFSQWIGSEERLAMQKFIRAVKKFRESDLDKTDKDIRRICHSRAMFKMKLKTESFIRKRAKKITKLQSSDLSESKIHQIRIHLKSISTIAALVCSLKPSKRLGAIITDLNRTEVMIGDWHDRVVLKEAIGKFLNSGNNLSKEELTAMEGLKLLADAEGQNLVLQFMPEVKRFSDEMLIV